LTQCTPIPETYIVKSVHEDVFYNQITSEEAEEKELERKTKKKAKALKKLMKETASIEKRTEALKKAEELKKAEYAEYEADVQQQQDEHAVALKKHAAALKKAEDEHAVALEKHAETKEQFAENMKEYEHDMVKYNDEVAKAKAEYAKKLAEQKIEIAQKTAAMNSDDDSWKKKISNEVIEELQAANEYDESIQDVEEAELDLNKAAAKLEKFRREPHVDDDGGVRKEQRERGSTISTSLSMFAVVALLGPLLQ